MIAYRIRVTGKVQGVFFRASTKSKAEILGLKGWVRNEEDGSVLIEVEGKNAHVEEFKSWCETGPDFARVSEIDSEIISDQGFTEFDIRY